MTNAKRPTDKGASADDVYRRWRISTFVVIVLVMLGALLASIAVVVNLVVIGLSSVPLPG